MLNVISCKFPSFVMQVQRFHVFPTKLLCRFQLSFSATDDTDCSTDHFVRCSRLLSVSYPYLRVRQTPRCLFITCSVSLRWSTAQCACIDTTVSGVVPTPHSRRRRSLFLLQSSLRCRTFQYHLPSTGITIPVLTIPYT